VKDRDVAMAPILSRVISNTAPYDGLRSKTILNVFGRLVFFTYIFAISLIINGHLVVERLDVFN